LIPKGSHKAEINTNECHYSSLLRALYRTKCNCVNTIRLLSCLRYRTALCAVVTDVKLMMHRGRPIFRLLSNVTAPALASDGRITSILQQRHSGPIDLAPLHPLSTSLEGNRERGRGGWERGWERIGAPGQGRHHRNRPTTCVHLQQVPSVMASWLLSASSLSLSLSCRANLRDTLCVCGYVELSGGMTTWTKRRRTC